MDELENLEEILSAVRKISEQLQTEKKLLTERISKLREENQRILAERNNLLVEMNNILAENERLRKVNEGFEKNLQQLPNKFQFIIRSEFQKFLTAATSSGEENFDEEKIFSEEKNLVPTQETEIEILDAEENLPAEINQSKKKMIYADFYAEEIGFTKD